MRKNSRLLRAAVVGVAAVIAACLGAANLSSSEQPVITISANPVFVGSAMVGSSVTSAPITISPQTNSDNDSIVSIFFPQPCPAFTLQGAAPLGGSGSAHVYCDGGGSGTGVASAVYGGEEYGGSACVPVTYSFTARFAPTTPGAQSCLVTIVTVPYGGGGSASYSLTLNANGQVPPYAITSSPSGATLGFGSIPVNTTSGTQRVTVTNSGSSPITLNLSNSNSGQFSVAGVSGATMSNQALGAGSAASYDVACTPTTAAMHTGTLAITGSPGSLTRAYTLSCTGINTTLQITPNPVAFPDDAIAGVAPAEIEVTIRNSGSAPTTLSEVALDPTGASGQVTIVGTNPQGTTLGSGGGSAKVRLRYSAATAREYGKLDTLRVAHTSGAQASEILVNGGALEAEVGIAPALVDFGSVCAGVTKTETVTLSAVAAGAVMVSSIEPPAAPFTATAQTGKLTVTPPSTLTVTASVTPTAAGKVEGSIAIHSNLPGEPRTIRLEATGLPAGVTPTPNIVYFGGGQVGALTTKKTVELTNCGTAPVTITSARIEGPSAGDFAIVSELAQEPVGQTASTTFDVVMTPHTNGLKRAQLVIDYDGGTAIVELDGNGFGGAEDEVLERETYYKCSAGGAGGLAPLGLALLLVRRRRRRAAA